MFSRLLEFSSKIKWKDILEDFTNTKNWQRFIFILFLISTIGLLSPILAENVPDFLLLSKSNMNAGFWVIYCCIFLSLSGMMCIILFKNQYRPAFIELLVIGLINFLIWKIGNTPLKCTTADRGWVFLTFGNNSLPLLCPFLVLSWIYLLVGSYRRRVWRKYQKKELVLNRYLEDNPLEIGNTIELKFRKLLEQVHPILFEDIYDHAFTIGIVGPWGTGKSSFIKSIESEIEKKGRQKPIYMAFSPFINHNEEQIIHEFFTQLSNLLKKRSGKLANKLLVYAEKLSNIYKGNSIKDIMSSTRYSNRHESVKELYDEINDCIRELDQKLIISIDDLDRLSGQEILEVLKLARNSSNFHNTVFIIALDKDYVANAICTEKEYMHNRFLDKFFQLELFLPHFNSTQLKKEIVTNFISGIGLGSSTPLMASIQKAIEISELKLFLKNYRDVKRFCNQIVFDYLLVSKKTDTPELEFKDFFNLTLLKLYYPKLHYYLGNEDQVLLDTNNHEGKIFLRRQKSDSFTSKIEDYFDDLKKEDLKSLGLDLENKSLKLLVALFGNKSIKSPMSIIHKANYYDYFESTIGMNTMSSNEFNEIMKMSVEQIEEMYIGKDERYIFLARRISYTDPNHEELEKLIDLLRMIWKQVDVLDLEDRINPLAQIFKRSGRLRDNQLNNLFKKIVNDENLRFEERALFLVTYPTELKSRLDENNKDFIRHAANLLHSFLQMYGSANPDAKSLINFYENLKNLFGFDKILNRTIIEYLRLNSPLIFCYEVLSKDGIRVNGWGINTIVEDLFGSRHDFLEFLKNHQLNTTTEIAEFIDFLTLKLIVNNWTLIYEFRNIPPSLYFELKRVGREEAYQIIFELHENSQILLNSLTFDDNRKYEIENTDYANRKFIVVNILLSDREIIYKEIESIGEMLYKILRPRFNESGRWSLNIGSYIEGNDLGEDPRTIVSIRSIQPPIETISSKPILE